MSQKTNVVRFVFEPTGADGKLGRLLDIQGEQGEALLVEDIGGIWAADGDFEELTLRLAPAAEHPDDAAVDRFALMMKEKLRVAREEKGRGGWEDKAACTEAELSTMLWQHVMKGDPVDVANLAMMLSLRDEKILPWRPDPGSEYDRGRRDVLNAILSINTDVGSRLSALKGNEAAADKPDGKLPFDVLFWVTSVAEQLEIEPKELT